MNLRSIGFPLFTALVVVGVASLAFLGQWGQAQEAEIIYEAVSSEAPSDGSIGLVSDHFRLDWDVIANGGATMGSSHFRLSSTAGQPIVGNSNSTHFDLRAGYWQNFFNHVFLPIILRN